MAIVTGSSAPPPAPWMARPATMPGRSPANAQTTEPDKKEDERSLERKRPADDIGEPADHWNRHDVGEEVAVDDPDVAVDVGGVDAKVGHHPGQDGGDDREIEGAQQDRHQGGAERTTVGWSQVHRRRGRLDRRLDRDVFAMMREIERPDGGVRPLWSRRLRELGAQQVMRLLIDPQIDRYW